jgi:sec-independent protein translocase protein TatC
MSAPTDHEPRQEEEQQEELHGQMSFFDHLEELRRRIIHSLIALAVAFGVCWYFANDLYHVFARLIDQAGGQLNFTGLTAPFTIQFKMALMAAIFLSSPFLLAQIWLFVSPGLYRRERQYALPFIFSSFILFCVGGLFGYFVALPFGIQFLIAMGKNDLGASMLLDATQAFDTVFALEIGFGAVFEIPAVIFLLSRIGIVSGPFLLRNFKYAVLGCFIAAAVITPTGDIPNMMILAVPMLVLYLLGVIVAFVFGKKRRPATD